jgi:hypothetical protein
VANWNHWNEIKANKAGEILLIQRKEKKGGVDDNRKREGPERDQIERSGRRIRVELLKGAGWLHTGEEVENGKRDKRMKRRKHEERNRNTENILNTEVRHCW